jgi:hypothetical protein
MRNQMTQKILAVAGIVFLAGLLVAAGTTINGARTVNGVLTLANGAVLGTPASVNLTNATALPCGAMPALTGAVTSSAGSCATTLATLTVIGRAVFSASGGSVSNLVTAGVVSNITRVSTGRFTVTLSPSQAQNYSTVYSCADNNAASCVAYKGGTGTQPSASSFDFFTFFIGSGVADSDDISVVLFR